MLTQSLFGHSLKFELVFELELSRVECWQKISNPIWEYNIFSTSHSTTMQYQDSIYVWTIFVPLFRTKQQGIFVCPRHNNPTLVAFYLPSVTLFTFQIIVNGRHFFNKKMRWNTDDSWLSMLYLCRSHIIKGSLTETYFFWFRCSHEPKKNMEIYTYTKLGEGGKGRTVSPSVMP